MNPVYIAAARRTAIGTFQGTLKSTSAVELGRTVVGDLLSSTGLDPKAVDEVIFGNVLSAGLGQNVARQIALKAGLPKTVPAYALNKVCGSGLKALQLAWQALRCGDAEVIVAGGTENMDQAAMLLPKETRSGLRLGHAQVTDSLIQDGLWCAENNYHMGITAENLAKKHEISREDQDRFACESQQRALAAIAAGRFNDEIVGVPVVERKETKNFATDEHPRASTLEQLAKLRPAFDPKGTVTAGNASGINDGAAACLMVSEAAVKRYNLKPIALVKGFAAAGVDPALMGYGPVPAVEQLMQKTGLRLADVDCFELNEAFAAQSLAVVRGLGLRERMKDINVNGGAIALGHPIGASGARIVVTLAHVLKQRQAKNGVAALCIGGGQGIAVLIERV